jgi:hypothetical protein
VLHTIHSQIIYKVEGDNSPTRVRKSNTTTAGPMSGKINANVDAKMMAKIQAPVANDGL